MIDCDRENQEKENQRRIDAVAERRRRAQSQQAHNMGGPPKPVYEIPTDPAGVYVDASFDQYFKVGLAVAVQVDSEKKVLDQLRWSGTFATSGDAEVQAIHLGIFLVRRKKLDLTVYTDYEGAVPAFSKGQVRWLPRQYMGVAHSRASRGMNQLAKQLRNRERAGR